MVQMVKKGGKKEVCTRKKSNAHKKIRHREGEGGKRTLFTDLTMMRGREKEVSASVEKKWVKDLSFEETLWAVAMELRLIRTSKGRPDWST